MADDEEDDEDGDDEDGDDEDDQILKNDTCSRLSLILLICSDQLLA